ncbi:hypothetical protein Q8O96_31085, partial [Pseudomonas sp. LPH60]|uniref:hypothetical protein n=1 Tax=Pseudomonas sp. LPH60 TaxID=3065906 RepID=UPI00273C0A9B
TSLAPVINSFSQITGSERNFLSFNHLGYLDYPANFSWSVQGATRYEVYSPVGLIYSGTSVSGFVYPVGSYYGRIEAALPHPVTYTLKAFNGPDGSSPVSVTTLVIEVQFFTQPDPDPSG